MSLFNSFPTPKLEGIKVNDLGQLEEAPKSDLPHVEGDGIWMVMDPVDRYVYPTRFDSWTAAQDYAHEALLCNGGLSKLTIISLDVTVELDKNPRITWRSVR